METNDNNNKKVKYRTALHECMHAVKNESADFLYQIIFIEKGTELSFKKGLEALIQSLSC